MDNFMDKLAEKYNAQDMIKANSQAETAQMQSLQEQVEAYETVLQEMRKLNYKNSELTEKMYALVDESLEKVRTLQIEAKEGGASPEAASAEMSEAVSRAVSEAVGSMDLGGIKDQLFEIKQSNTNTEESLSAVAAAVASMQGAASQTANDEILEAIREADSSLRDQMNAIAAAMQAMPSTVVNETREINSTTDITDIEEAVRKSAEVIDGIRDGVGEVKESFGSVNEKLGTIEEMVREIKEKEAAAPAVAAEAPAEPEVQREMPAMPDVSGIENNTKDILEKIEELRQSTQINSITMESLSALAQSGAQTHDLLTEIRASLQEKPEIPAPVVPDNSEVLSAIADIRGSIDSVAGNINELAASGKQAAESEEEVSQSQASLEEISLSLRTMRSAADENRNAIRSALDSAIYGIKQDNREVVGVLQRLNSAISNNFDPITKEEEERVKTEEERKFLDERMKAAEDFMHKESVKVYRNVQAVINEKSDKTNENLEETIRKLSGSVSGLKKIAVGGLILGIADLAVLIMYIAGILH